MKRTLLIAAVLLLALSSPGEAPDARDTLYQFSTIQALKDGVYDGMKAYGQIEQRGDFGLGTFTDLDGEMIEIEDVVYQVKIDGSVHRVTPDTRTPFVAITYFDTDAQGRLNTASDYPKTKEYLDSKLETLNIPVAIRLHGTFTHVKTRSVPAQKKPYPPLAEVVKHQQTFEATDIEGTALGFRCPTYMDGVQAVGYHLHFISDDREFGGHLLEFTTADVTYELDYTHEFEMELPEGGGFYQTTGSGESGAFK